MPKTMIKIHISRDFSFAEFDLEADPVTGEGLPDAENLRCLYNLLPAKDAQPEGSMVLRPPSESPRRAQQQAQGSSTRRGYTDPPATANQRRVLERYGEWVDGMTKSEASEILRDMGF